MLELLLPKYKRDLSHDPLFLAGPIRGAPAWHYDAIDYLVKQEHDLSLVIPIRQMRGDMQNYLVSSDCDFDRQRRWEIHYLNQAWERGCVLFWLPEEAYHNCSKAYGAMTRTELGETLMRYTMNPQTNFVIGSDGQFSEMRTLLVDIEEFAPNTKIYSTLDDTCDAALKMLKQK